MIICIKETLMITKEMVLVYNYFMGHPFILEIGQIII